MENNWKLHHVGVAIRDADKALEYYQSLGIVTGEPKVRGGDSFKLINAQIGSIVFELIQPVHGESPQKEFINSRGEGIDHIGFTVDDLDKETAKLAEKGVSVIISGRFQTGGGYAYFDTRKVGNVIIELIQW